MSDKIINLGIEANNGKMMSPIDQLKEAIADIEAGHIDPDQILILSVNTKDQFSVNFHQAGMKMSECLALCEVAKTIFLTQMDYIN